MVSGTWGPIHSLAFSLTAIDINVQCSNFQTHRRKFTLHLCVLTLPPSSLSVRYMKKVEEPIRCMVMVCASGLDVKNCVRTLDSF